MERGLRKYVRTRGPFILSQGRLGAHAGPGGPVPSLDAVDVQHGSRSLPMAVVPSS